MIDETNRNTALASALAEELARSGVRRAVVSPGSRSTPVALALDREPGIELEIVLDERSAGFVGLGAALAAGEPVALACTSGSAAANLHPAIAEADLAGVPLVALTSDRPPELRGIGAGQTIDQIGLFGSAVRWFCEVGNHDADDDGVLHYRSVACRAVSEAIGGRGPVHLNLPWRDPLGPEPRPGEVTAADPLAREGRDGGRPLTAGIAARAPQPELVRALADALARSQRPLMIAGREPRAGVAAALAALAAERGIPVLAEPTSGLRVGKAAGDRSVAHYDLILRDPPAALEPDLVVRCGDMPTSKPLRVWLARPAAADQIVIGAPGRWNEPTHRAGAVVDGDPRLVLEALHASLGGPDNDGEPGWGERWRTADAAAGAAIEEALAAAPAMNEPALARAYVEAIGQGELGLIASSMPIRDVEAFGTVAERDAHLFSNRGANGIDGLVATACGLARGARRKTWALLGDLALAHDIGSLQVAAMLGAPLRVVLVDNGGGHIFDFLPQAVQLDEPSFGRLFHTPAGLDYEAVAEAFGLRYALVSEPAELSRLGAGDGGPMLLHATLDAEHNVPLHRNIAEAVGTAVAAAL